MDYLQNPQKAISHHFSHIVGLLMFSGKLPKTQYFDNDPKRDCMEDNVHVLFKLEIIILAARRTDRNPLHNHAKYMQDTLN